MRKAIIPILLVAVLTAAVLLAGCALTGTSAVVTEEKEFTDFTDINVDGPFEVEITQSDLFSTTVSANGNYMDYVAVAQEGETLKIYLNPRHPFTDFTLKSRTFKAKITLPALYGLKLSGAAKGTVSGFKSSRDFSLTLSGACSLEMVDIEVGDAEFEISGASKITGNINAAETNFTVSGASLVELEGLANSITLNASGASQVSLANFPLDTASINLSGASEATLNVKEKLSLVLTDASRLYFQGNPAMGDINVSGASTVKHK